MTRSVGARELKTRLGTYIEQVRRGVTLIVTERGEPVAELRPIGRKRDDEASRRLSEGEVASALGRRCREGMVSADDRDRALARLREDIGSMYVVELSAEIAAAARALLLRHPLRAADAIQLASCLHLAEQLGAPAELVVYDVPLVTAARSEGLRVLHRTAGRAARRKREGMRCRRSC